MNDDDDDGLYTLYHLSYEQHNFANLAADEER
jgi:hypothetical protein